MNDPTVKPAATKALKALFEKIVLTPDSIQPDDLRVELHGAFAAILVLDEQQKAAKLRDLAAFGVCFGG